MKKVTIILCLAALGKLTAMDNDGAMTAAKSTDAIKADVNTRLYNAVVAKNILAVQRLLAHSHADITYSADQQEMSIADTVFNFFRATEFDSLDHNAQTTVETLLIRLLYHESAAKSIVSVEALKVAFSNLYSNRLLYILLKDHYLRHHLWDPFLLLLNQKDLITNLSSEHGGVIVHAIARTPLPAGKIEAISDAITGLIEQGVYINYLINGETALDGAWWWYGQGNIPLLDDSKEENNEVKPILRAFGGCTIESDRSIGRTNDFLDLLWTSFLRTPPRFKRIDPCETVDKCRKLLADDPSLISRRCPYSNMTPCMLLAATGQTELLRNLLKEYGCRALDIDAVTAGGWTALHFAAYNGKGEIVRELLRQPDIITCPYTKKRPWMDKDAKGLSPYALALIGTKAREQGNEHLNDTAINVLDKFLKDRIALILIFKQLARNLNRTIPLDIIKLFVGLYRFSDPQAVEQREGPQPAQAAAELIKVEDSPITNDNNKTHTD